MLHVHKQHTYIHAHPGVGAYPPRCSGVNSHAGDFQSFRSIVSPLLTMASSGEEVRLGREAGESQFDPPSVGNPTITDNADIYIVYVHVCI